jgi:hypothetical protein
MRNSKKCRITQHTIDRFLASNEGRAFFRTGATVPLKCRGDGQDAGQDAWERGLIYESHGGLMPDFRATYFDFLRKSRKRIADRIHCDTM